MAKCKYKGQFGPMVIGADEAEEEKAAMKEGREIFGSKVIGSHPTKDAPLEAAVVEVVEAAEPVTPDESLSVRKVKEALKETSAPAVLDRFARAEFLRPEGARKSVLDILVAKERGREDPAPRAEAIEALESKLAELAGE